MLVLALTVVLAQAAPPATPPRAAPAPAKKAGPKLPEKPPPAAETAKLYFLAGDLATAQDWARRGLKTEPKTCGPLNAQLAEYAFLANQMDQPTPEQVKAFFELDRKISPTVRGKLTEKAWERFVSKPLALAQAQADGGGASMAGTLVEQVLTVDPKNAEALALKARLNGGPGNRKDAGP